MDCPPGPKKVPDVESWPSLEVLLYIDIVFAKKIILFCIKQKIKLQTRNLTLGLQSIETETKRETRFSVEAPEEITWEVGFAKKKKQEKDW